jgi:hypothetical protein
VLDALPREPKDERLQVVAGVDVPQDEEEDDVEDRPPVEAGERVVVNKLAFENIALLGLPDINSVGHDANHGHRVERDGGHPHPADDPVGEHTPFGASDTNCESVPEIIERSAPHSPHMPVLADTPLTVRRRATGEISVRAVEDLAEDHKSYDALTHLGWTPILRVVARPSDKDMYSLHNRESWINVESDTQFLLCDADMKEKQKYLTDLLIVKGAVAIILSYLDTEVIQNITRKTVLMKCRIPQPCLTDKVNSTPNKRIVCRRCPSSTSKDLNVYRSCVECPNYNLCMQCYGNCKVEAEHTDLHPFRLSRKYNNAEMLNTNNNETLKEYLAADKTVTTSVTGDYWYRLVGTAVGIQEWFLLLKRSGFRPHVDRANRPTSITYKLTYKFWLYTVSKTKKDFSYAQYRRVLETISPVRYVVWRFSRLPTGVQFDRFISTIFIYDDEKQEQRRTELRIEEDNDKGHKEQCTAIFDSRKDVVYEVHTQNGFYQAGIGSLVLKD